MMIFWQLAALAYLTGAYGSSGPRDDWDDYRSGAKKLLDAIEAKLDAREAEARKQIGPAGRLTAADQLELRARVADARRDLERIANSPRLKRDALRARIDATIKALEDAVGALSEPAETKR